MVPRGLVGFHDQQVIITLFPHLLHYLPPYICINYKYINELQSVTHI